MPQDVDEYLHGIFKALPMTDPSLMEIREAQQEDGEIQRAVEYTVSGWTPKAMSHQLYGVRDHLIAANGLLMYVSHG